MLQIENVFATPVPVAETSGASPENLVTFLAVARIRETKSGMTVRL